MPSLAFVRVACSCSLVAVAAAQQAPRADYVVLAAVDEGDPFDAAAQKLAQHRRAPIVRFAVGDLEPVRAALARATPRCVALVLRPEQVEFGFARRFLQLATELDDDPFVDFAFGYITGQTATDAVALVERAIARQPKREPPRVAQVAGGVDKSFATERPHPLRTLQLAGKQIYVAGAKAFPDAGRDRAFLAEHLPALTGHDIVTFIGHGYPREVVGGPAASDLDGLRLDGAVVFNVACYTGVTQAYYEDDYQRRVTERKEIAPGESFGLALLRTGVVGYTAYLCPRPAGPELDTDLAALCADGASLGDARRRDYDKTVLGFLGYDEDRLRLRPVAGGQAIGSIDDAVRDLMLEGATGGVLFGDPAVVPFAGVPDQAPVAIAVERGAGTLRIRAEAAPAALFLHCSDPTARFGKQMAMKVYARVPLGQVLVADVVVDELTLGGLAQPTRVVWAVETDHGERFLQVKVNFARPQRLPGKLVASVRVITTDVAADARHRGKGGQPEPQANSAVAEPADDQQARQATAAMLERAAARKVSRPALQAALDAHVEALGEGGATAARDKLAALRSEGFRAVCALLDVGHAHYRTWTLLQATWQKGDERELLALADGEPLPNYASWQVLEGLGVADTPEVRAYLLQRLRTEDDAGLFMATATGLAHLGEREAAAAVGDRVLEFRERWQGVEPHLIEALGRIGGPAAVERLAKIAADPRTKAADHALAWLDRLDAGAAKRVRAQRGGR